jgi:hypothetical protein
MTRGEALAERWESFQRWRRDLVAEVVALPETLRQFREGVATFQVVGRRLADSSEALEQVNELYSLTFSDRVRQVTDATAALQRQLARARTARPPGSDLLEQAVEDFNRTVGALIELNPFLRPRRS